MSTTQNIVVRPATPEDVPTLLKLIRSLAEYEKLAEEVVATEADLHQSLFCEHPRVEAIIGEIGDQVVGFALFFHNFSTWLGKSGIYIEDIYVEPSMRSKGLGTRLLLYVAKLANERDCGRLEWSVLNWNRPAIDFYLKLCAKPMDGWTVYRVSGDVLKQLAL